MDDLEAQRQAVLASIGALSQEKAATLEQVQALRVQVVAVNEAVAQLEHEQAVKLPRVKCVLPHTRRIFDAAHPPFHCTGTPSACMPTFAASSGTMTARMWLGTSCLRGAP